MAGTESKLMVHNEGDAVVVQFVDRNILDEASIQQIGQELGDLVDNADSPKFLISFENVDHLSSAALGTLITINNKVRQQDGQLRLANIDPQIYEVFTITKLDKLFQIHETTEQALKSFK
jgi:anti-sigma B factor antagonist